jgi:hypothetical protein
VGTYRIAGTTGTTTTGGAAVTSELLSLAGLSVASAW